MIENALTLPWDIGILTMLTVSGMIAWSAQTWLKKSKRKPLWMKAGVLSAGSVALAVMLVIGYGSFIEPQIITVTPFSIPLGTTEPLRIAIISDLHVGPYKGFNFIRRVTEHINALHPDVVLIVGDLVLTEEIRAESLAALEPLKNLHPVIGTYAIMGNHDHSIYRTSVRDRIVPDRSDAVAERLMSFGIAALRNSSVTLRSGESVFAIAGIEDAFSGEADILETFANIPPNVPTILMSHNPDVILDPASLRARIIVTGHTHGGQIRLPWIGPVATLPTHLGKKFDQGIFSLGSGAILAITRGVGESGPRARLLAPPEIMLITTIPDETSPSI